MAVREVETAFVASFWSLADSADGRDSKRVLDLATRISPTMFEDQRLATAYNLIAGRFAEGLPTFSEDLLRELERRVGMEVMISLTDRAVSGGENAAHYAELVLADSRRRDAIGHLQGVIRRLSNTKARDGGRQLVEEAQIELARIYADNLDEAAGRTLDDMLDRELELMESDEPGVVVPWPRLESACGPWVSGEVVGVSGYSGTGKSSFAANLAFSFARRRVPVIAFPTEMRDRWLSRGLAAVAGVRQAVAEKRQWKRATDEERARYRKAIEEARLWPLAVVDAPNISPAEIVARTRILRRQWPGRPVVVIVDHMHRLDYGAEDTNVAVGPATKMLKNFAGSDPDGLIFVLLYQPRKPEHGSIHRAVAGHQIRGNSMVWNELDVHLSPFRSWVKASETLTNPWGAPRTLRDPAGSPRSAKPESEGSKLDDEHYYIKIDKLRVGGEGGVVVLNFEKPSGRIYEVDEFSDLVERSGDYYYSPRRVGDGD